MMHLMQFDCQEFTTFASSYGFKDQASMQSLHFSEQQISGESIENDQETPTKSSDPQIALINYQALPLHWCQLSQTQLLVGSHVRATLPQMQQSYIVQFSYFKYFQQQTTHSKHSKRKATSNVIVNDIYHHFQKILQSRSRQVDFNIHQVPLTKCM